MKMFLDLLFPKIEYNIKPRRKSPWAYKGNWNFYVSLDGKLKIRKIEELRRDIIEKHPWKWRKDNSPR